MSRPRYMNRPPKRSKRERAGEMRREIDKILDMARVDATRRDWHRFVVWCVLCVIAFTLGAVIF